jgi:hypothetical protein
MRFNPDSYKVGRNVWIKCKESGEQAKAKITKIFEDRHGNTHWYVENFEVANTSGLPLKNPWFSQKDGQCTVPGYEGYYHIILR